MNNRRDINEKDLQRARVGKRFWNASLEQIPDETKYKSTLKKFTKNITKYLQKGNGIIFTGEYGTGKTGSSVICIKEALRTKHTALLIRSRNIQKAALNEIDFDRDTSLWERANDVDLLVIDDLGNEYTKEFGSKKIAEIVRCRYDDLKSTIITSNMGIEMLKRNYREVTEVLSATCVHIELNEISWRDRERESLNLASEINNNGET